MAHDSGSPSPRFLSAVLLFISSRASFADLANPSREEVRWTVRESGPRLWHTDRLVSDATADAILDLTGLREEPWEWSSNVHTISILQQDHPAIMEVRQRIADAQGLPLANFEPAFVLEYMPGMDVRFGQSMPHYDWNCADGRGDDTSEQGCPHMRVSTNILYLNTLPSPLGETVLPKAGLSFPVKKGSFVGWHNGDYKTRQKDPLAQHFGRGIPSSEDNATRKYALVNWIRATAIDFENDYSSGLCKEDPDFCAAADSLRRALEGSDAAPVRRARPGQAESDCEECGNESESDVGYYGAKEDDTNTAEL